MGRMADATGGGWRRKSALGGCAILAVLVIVLGGAPEIWGFVAIRPLVSRSIRTGMSEAQVISAWGEPRRSWDVARPGDRPWWVDQEFSGRGRALLYVRWYFWGNVAVVYVNEAGAVERVSVRSSS